MVYDYLGTPLSLVMVGPEPTSPRQAIGRLEKIPGITESVAVAIAFPHSKVVLT